MYINCLIILFKTPNYTILSHCQLCGLFCTRFVTSFSSYQNQTVWSLNPTNWNKRVTELFILEAQLLVMSYSTQTGLYTASLFIIISVTGSRSSYLPTCCDCEARKNGICDTLDVSSKIVSSVRSELVSNTHLGTAV